MAPLSRGRAGFRGRGSQRGRSRGRGRAGGVTGTRKSSTFYSTRVEQTADSGTESSSESENEEEDNGESDGDTSSEEDEVDGTTARPYNVLLQSLKPPLETGPPARKRRRVEREGFKIREIDEGSTSDLTGYSDEEEAIDGADEPEEEHSAKAEESDEEVEDDGGDDASDPFDLHFAHPDENELSRNLRMLSENKWQPPRAATPLDWRPAMSTGREAISGPQDLKLKKRLYGPASRIFSPFGRTESILASQMFKGYCDILFPARSVANAESLRRLTCLHVLNHILKTRDAVIKNNARLSKASEDADLELRDQGFTRPKVLMLLPTRQACVKFIDTITALFEPEQQENKKRFQDTFSRTDEKFSDDKSEDFKELFDGNDDDMFRIGLKITRKTFKLFAPFYSSDIIFASPLGLRMAIGAEGAKKEDYDFLSSIEIVVVDHADALLMQNWEHVEYIFEHLNLQPREARGCDFSRVRNWYLDGNSKFLRQTIVFSAFETPEIYKLFNKYMQNVAGKMHFMPRKDGLVGGLGVDVKQTFSRYHSPSAFTDPDTRFKYFTTAIVPSLTRQVRSAASGAQGAQGTLILIPSYLDFVRVRNYFSDSSATQNISFGSISEYTSIRDVARARSHFFSGRHAVLLYTERAHHFRRYHIRGVKKVVMYGLPDNPIFYRDIAGGYIAASVAEGKITSSEAGVRSMFCKWDLMKLQRIVGTSRVVDMLEEKSGDTFDFI